MSISCSSWTCSGQTSSTTSIPPSWAPRAHAGHLRPPQLPVSRRRTAFDNRRWLLRASSGLLGPPQASSASGLPRPDSLRQSALASSGFLGPHRATSGLLSFRSPFFLGLGRPPQLNFLRSFFFSSPLSFSSCSSLCDSNDPKFVSNGRPRQSTSVTT